MGFGGSDLMKFKNFLVYFELGRFHRIHTDVLF